VAASYSDSVVFLSDGRISGRLDSPTPDRILDRLRALGG
jgi:putative ABC transport system ATP-binding protein